jgi:hypothetical protein
MAQTMTPGQVPDRHRTDTRTTAETGRTRTHPLGVSGLSACQSFNGDSKMQTTPRLTRKQAAEAYALQLTAPNAEPEPKRDPDALQGGRSIQPVEAEALATDITNLADVLARKGVHRWHIAEVIAETCCAIHRIGTARGIEAFVAAEREQRTTPNDAMAAEIKRQIG